MEIQFVGATGTVTGSKYILKTGEKNYLVDCGLYQGLKVLRLRNWKSLPVRADKIEAVLLTHAHIDHSGYIPLLVKNGFHGKVYATEATSALCEILLPDSGFLQEEDAAFANKHGYSKHEKALPLYTVEDARKSLRHFASIPYGETTVVDSAFRFEFLPAGHILGSSMVRIHLNGKTLLFTGDMGRMHDTIMRPPVQVKEADYLVLESTYGNRSHDPTDPLKVLEKIVNQTIHRGGVLLIPSFAVGRTQKVLHMIYQLQKERRIPPVPVYLDSPMATEATRLFCKYDGEQAISEEECRAFSSMTHFVSTPAESKKISASTEPAIVLSASGMATGGRVLHHLKTMAPRPQNSILFVGFQAPGTRGHSMLHGATAIKIHGEYVPILAPVHSMESISAHADADEIMGWLRNFSRPPRTTFLVHGEPESSEALRKRIKEELHWNCVIPDYLESFELK